MIDDLAAHSLSRIPRKQGKIPLKQKEAKKNRNEERLGRNDVAVRREGTTHEKRASDKRGVEKIN